MAFIVVKASSTLEHDQNELLIESQKAGINDLFVRLVPLIQLRYRVVHVAKVTVWNLIQHSRVVAAVLASHARASYYDAEALAGNPHDLFSQSAESEASSGANIIVLVAQILFQESFENPTQIRDIQVVEEHILPDRHWHIPDCAAAGIRNDPSPPVFIRSKNSEQAHLVDALGGLDRFGADIFRKAVIV